jgi:hypothetical protein
MSADRSLSPRPPEEATREQCRFCGAPATVELFTGYRLCRPCCAGLGREAMKVSEG